MSHKLNPAAVDSTTAMPQGINIANIITDFGVSERVVDTVQMAFIELFNSEIFVGSSRRFREDVLLDYKLVLDTLQQINKVEIQQYPNRKLDCISYIHVTNNSTN